MRKLEDEKTALEKYLEDVKAQSEEIRAWLLLHPETEIDPDTIVRINSALRWSAHCSLRPRLAVWCPPVQVQAADPLSAQLLEETARIEAIDDTLYALGSAFRDSEDPEAQQAVRAYHFSLPPLISCVCVCARVCVCSPSTPRFLVQN